MRNMKDSGVKWIGYIPEHWDVTSTKHVFSVVSGATPNSDNPDYFDGNIPWITPADYKTEDVYVSYGKRKITQLGLNSCNTTLVPRNSIIFSKRAPIGSVAINSVELCTNQGCLACVSHEAVDIKYFYYFMSISTEQYDLLGVGTTFKEISATSFSDFKLVAPPVIEQLKISSYLDRKCALIDSTINNTKDSIEEYKKLKQAIITQAVTKGVRGDRPMKDSGIEWIGEIPEEWQLIPFRHVLNERQEKNSPIKTRERLSLSIDLGVTLYAEKTTNLDRFKEDFEQYKLAHVGDLVMNSMNMIVGATGVSDYYGCVSPVYYTFYDETPNHTTAKYCEYIFRSKTMLRVLYSLGKGIYAIVRGDDRVNTCRLKVSKEDLKNIIIPLPSLEEQTEIIDFLNIRCVEIDRLIEKKDIFMSELESYKKSMIFEYVTGKKEVPST